MKITYSHVITGVALILLVFCVYFAQEAIITRIQLNDTQEQLEQVFNLLIDTNDRLIDTQDEYLEMQLVDLQRSAWESNTVIVGTGASYVETTAITSDGISGFYFGKLLKGTWQGQSWEFAIKPGDYIRISGERSPGKLIASVRRYAPEDGSITKFEAVLAQK